jgi:hypothetical protein
MFAHFARCGKIVGDRSKKTLWIKVKTPAAPAVKRRSGRRLGAPMSPDDKIYVDAQQPATLNNGAGKLTDCRTLQEAVMAWHRLRLSKRSGDDRMIEIAC